MAPPILSLRAQFQRAARELGIEVRTDVELAFPSGRRLEVPIVVPQFGAENGMLVVGSFDVIAPVEDEVDRAGYGVSVLEDPETESVYDLQSFVEMLNDWGWNEACGVAPSWITDQY